MKPFLKKVSGRNQSAKLMFGGGINTGNTPFTIGLNQGTYMRNVSPRKFPALASTEGYAAYAAALTTPNGLGQRGNTILHVVDGTTWKYWDTGTSTYVNVQTGLANATAQFDEFYYADGTLCTIMSNGTQRYMWDGTGAATALTGAPLSKVVVAHKQRLYWGLANAITYCVLDDPTDYTTAGEGGSGLIIVNLQGGITAMRSFDNHIIVWGDYGMFQLFGTDISDFALNQIKGKVGCVTQRASVVSNTRLFFLGRAGVFLYSTEPVLISQNISTYIDDINWSYKNLICSGATKNYLYFSVPYGTSQTTNNITLVYDLEQNEWYVQDRGYKDFVQFDGKLYGVNNSGTIYQLEYGTTWAGTKIEWDFITPAFSGNNIEKFVSLAAIDLIMDMPGGSNLKVSYSDDIDGTETQDWTAIKTVESSDFVKGIRIHVPMHNLYDKKFFRLRFAGTGECVLHYVQMDYRTV